MKCPLWSGGRVRLFARRGHEALPGSRDGAGNEDTGSNLAGDGEADYVVAGSGDHRDQRPADAAMERSEERRVGKECRL